MPKRKDKLAKRNHVYAVTYTRHVTCLITNRRTKVELTMYTPANDKREAMNYVKHVKANRVDMPNTIVRNVFSIDNVELVSQRTKKRL